MKLLFLLLAVFASLALVACSGDDDDDDADTGSSGGDTSGGNEVDLDSELTVVATTSQIGALVEEVAGTLVDYSVLIGAGVDAHDFEASAADVRRVGDADVVLRNGIGLDDFLDSLIDGSGTDAEVVTVTDGIELFAGESSHEHEEEADEEEDHEGEFDPHVWQDPLNVKLMVENIAAALSAADPANAELYAANAQAYLTVLDETHTEIEALIAAIPEANRKIVTNHDAFGYFIRRYGLEYVGAVIPSTSTQAEPSAEQIADLIDLIESTGVLAIFAESSIDPTVAEQIAADTGITIVDDLYGDSLGEPGSGADTVHGMLLTNAEKISEALQ